MAVLYMGQDQVVSGWTTLTVWDLRRRSMSVIIVVGDHMIALMAKMYQSAACLVRIFSKACSSGTGKNKKCVTLKHKKIKAIEFH